MIDALSNYFDLSNIDWDMCNKYALSNFVYEIATYYNLNFKLGLDDIATHFKISKETFVYLDPPYDPVSDTAKFTGYAKGGFDRTEQLRLKECCDTLDKCGIKFMLSNSATDFIKEQYSSYNITIVKAKRAVNSNAAKRGHIDEVIIRNYD